MLKTSSLRLAGKQLVWGARTYLMGILNITPDSFSGDGLLQGSDKEVEVEETRLEHILGMARLMVAAGADIIDIGGESTRPGASPVSAEIELQRILPVVKRLAAEMDTILSVDTYKASVAEAALQAGAHLINDVWGLHAEANLASVIADHGAPVILMHNRSSWVSAEHRQRLKCCHFPSSSMNEF